VRVFHKPSICFHLPGSVAPPLILLGPGKTYVVWVFMYYGWVLIIFSYSINVF
jgi:hypothetical protein